MDSIHLVYSGDEKYLKFLEMPIGSAYLWAADPNRLIVDVITIDVPDEAWTKWRENLLRYLPHGARVERLIADVSRFSGLREWHGSLGAYGRLLLPELLSDEDWCIYADGDTVFTDDPLKLIDECTDSEVSIRGHLEKWLRKKDADQRAWYAERGLERDESIYFNSGFVLINLDWFRRNDAGEKTIGFLRKYPDAPLPDQDALNVICYKTSKALPYAWGTFGCEAFAYGRPSAIHYPGHLPQKCLEGMFPDFLDAFNIWFRYARIIFGRGWREMVVTKPNTIRYFQMRALGVAFSCMRKVMTPLHLLWIPKIGRYLRRHYASAGVWRELLQVPERRKTWN